MSTRAWLLLLVLFVGGILAGSPGSAVIIDSGDGTGNTTAPPSDPGWDHLGFGLSNGLTVIYLGDGAVLTANHVGAQDISLGGTTYAFVPGSDVRIGNGDGSFADLRIFEVFPEPALPGLTLASNTPTLGTSIIAAGRGRNRGAATSWDPPGPPPPISGYLWVAGSTLRWGTNFIEDLPASRILDTEAMSSTFDAGGSAHESQGATGDSGGAVWVDNAGQWELAGVIFAVSEFEGQPSSTSLYGQLTHYADLAFYKSEIENLVTMPEPRGGAGWGALLVCVLARRRRR